MVPGRVAFGEDMLQGCGGCLVDGGEHGFDADFLGEVVQEEHQDEHAGDGEEERQGDGDLWDEQVLAVGGGADGAEHRERVGESAEEQPEGGLHEPVAT